MFPAIFGPKSILQSAMQNVQNENACGTIRDEKLALSVKWT